MLDIINKIIWNDYFISLIILYIAYIFINQLYSNQRIFTNESPELCIIMNAYMEDILYDQLDNFNKYITTHYIVIINCSNNLYHKLKDKQLSNVILNPYHFEKKRFHGSLLEGIVSNINHLLSLPLNISHILILSNRCFFKEYFNLYENIQYNKNTSRIKGKINLNDWHWPKFKKTLLFKNSNKISLSEHEGLFLTIQEAKYINDFMIKNPIIREELFNFDACVEEFALQTILINGNHNFRQLYQFELPFNKPLNEKIKKIYIYKKY